MKKKLLGYLFVFVLLSTSINANLLNDLVWAGTKAAATSVYDREMQNSRNNRTSTKNKRSKSKKTRKKTVVYHCSAKAFRASGWAESTSLSSAKRIAIGACMKRRVSNKECRIQSCYKK